MTKFENALNKMNEEMKTPHTPELDRIHNWLCEQLDMDQALMETELADGILNESHSISGAMNFCYKKAQSEAEKGAQYAMVSDNTVFGWIKEYFLTKETKENNVVKPIAKSDKPTTAANDQAIGFKQNVQSTAESNGKASATAPTKKTAKTKRNHKAETAEPVQVEAISLFDF
ncbi:Cas9 inhibitor AcrIIA9 family protein [Limosilactobacillus allomucosae]|uniref:Cas9 inhibitor AcrIIA9 family protein n=1 Tax=Limosilactobacillus allomucosae TaxID=3142938 RepID=UPI0032650E4B